MTAAVARPRVWTTDPSVIAEERRATAVVETMVAVDKQLRADGLKVNDVRRTPAPCAVRLGKPDDLAYVVDSWTKHAHRGERMRNATAHVRGLLGRDGAQLFVAHVTGEPDAILGWALLESGTPACLHYVYVRSSARRLGVARTLLDGVAERFIEYSVAAPSDVEVPRRWVMNTKRAKT